MNASNKHLIWSLGAGILVVCAVLSVVLTKASKPSGESPVVAGPTQFEDTEPQNPKLILWYGHRDSVTEVAVSPDGKYLLTGGTDGALCVWELATGHLRYTLQGLSLSRSAQVIAFSPDGKRFATLESPYTIGVWDLGTGRKIQALVGHRDSVYCVKFVGDANHLISAGSNSIRAWDITDNLIPKGSVLTQDADVLTRIWQLRGFRPTDSVWTRLTSDDSVQSITKIMLDQRGSLGVLAWGGRPLHSRNEHIVSILANKELKIWDVLNKRLLRSLHIAGGRPFSIVISPRGNYVAIGYEDGSIDVVNWASGVIHRKKHQHDGAIKSMAFAPDEAALFSGGEDQLARRWEFLTDVTQTYPARRLSQITSIEFSTDDTYIAAGTADGRVNVWRHETGELNHSIQDTIHVCDPPDDPRCRTKSILRVHFTNDGSSLVAVGRNGHVSLWDTDGASLRRTWSIGSSVSMVDFGNEGTLAVWTRRHLNSIWPDSYREGLEILNMETGHLLMGELEYGERHPYLPNSLTFTQDGTEILLGDLDGILRSSSLDTIRGVERYEVNGGVALIAIDPQRRFVASAHHYVDINLYNQESLEVERVLRGQTDIIGSLAFSPNGGQLLSTGLAGTAILWDVSTSLGLLAFKILRGIQFGTFSQDGSRFMLVDEDGICELRDVWTGRLLVSLAAFSDGEWISWTPELYYDSSDEIEDSLIILEGGHPLPLSKLSWLRRPDVIADVLSTDP